MKRPFWSRGKDPLLEPDEIFADSASALEREGLERRMERSLGRWYAYLFLGLVGLGLGFLAVRTATLSIVKGEAFFLKAQENRFSFRPTFPARGVIFDRFGRPLVENIPTFGLIFKKNDFLGKSQDLAHLLEELSKLLGKPKEFFYDLGFPRDYGIEHLPDRLTIVQDLSRDLVITVASKLGSLPGVQIFEGYRRIYQDPYAYSHLLGFTGKVSAEDLKSRPELKEEQTLGKSGIEAFYDRLLRGKRGQKIVEIDAVGRETRYRFTQASEEGARMFLSIDGELQKMVYRTLQNFIGLKGGASVVVLDPQNGAVRALVSFPGFDSNRWGQSLAKEEFEHILKDPLKPLFNRAISGEFPPGSTIKPLVAAAALEERIIDPHQKIYDEGFIAVPHPYRPGEESIFLDWKKHGWVDFYDAIAWSANVYFYMIGGGYREQKGLGIERIKKYAILFGLGSLLEIDLPGEKRGLFPDPELKKEIEPQDPFWRVGDTYNVSIGQGSVKTTPLQMAILTAAISNGGKVWQPYVREAIFDKEAKLIKKREPHLIREHIVSPDNLEQVVYGMRRTVTHGTARRLADLPVAAAAKTGTAQIGPSRLPHAWVTAFAPVDNPEVALAVIVEHAGEGATVAVPITHEILKWYFENRR